MTRRVLLSWSSGKDSAWTLHVLRAEPDVEVIGLLTTVNTAHGRVSMHATRLEILQAQARSVGLPLQTIPLPQLCSNEVYEEAMRRAIEDGIKIGATYIAFGDLLLEDIRAYRIKQLEGTGLAPLFPLWQEPTALLARRMVDAGLKAVVTCVDLKRLPPSFAGRWFDHSFLDDLPSGVDPCGENGEFHTCVLDGPMFSEPVWATVGEVVERDGFCFADLVPEEDRGSEDTPA
ncbi:MAG: adenine nucleotide alpha hydrolase [Nitrospira sp.]|nr:adenine nucleotide alpha hydrolase [Nitrospira sp.]